MFFLCYFELRQPSSPSFPFKFEDSKDLPLHPIRIHSVLRTFVQGGFLLKRGFAQRTVLA
jgi:hypothetical protein